MMGIINKVSKVVAVKPPTTVIAIGALNSDPAEVLNAIGSIPKIVVKAVIKTGLSLTEQA